MAEPRNLFYYPRSPSAWLERTAGLSPLARAAVADLEGQAWTAPKRGAAPCSLPDDDATLARMARLELREWKKVSAEVRGLLMYRDGVLVDEVLLKVWNEQQVAYTKRATAGATGGKSKAKRQQSSSNATALLQQSELELEEVLPPSPYGDGEVAPSAADAGLAPAGAAPADVASRTANSNGTGDYLRAPSNRESLARAGYRPDPDAPPVPVTPLAEQAAAIREHADRYRSLLESSVTEWQDDHPEESLALEHEEVARQGLRGRVLGIMATQALRQAVVETLRTRMGWPTLETWDGADTFTPSEVPAPC